MCELWLRKRAQADVKALKRFPQWRFQIPMETCGGVEIQMFRAPAPVREEDWILKLRRMFFSFSFSLEVKLASISMRMLFWRRCLVFLIMFRRLCALLLTIPDQIWRFEFKIPVNTTLVFFLEAGEFAVDLN